MTYDDGRSITVNKQQYRSWVTRVTGATGPFQYKLICSYENKAEKWQIELLMKLIEVTEYWH